jgi:hypothetical protein
MTQDISYQAPTTRSSIPVSEAKPLPVGGPVIGTTADAAVTDPTNLTASFMANFRGLMTGIGQMADAAWASGPGNALAYLRTIATQALSTAPVSVNSNPTASGTLAPSKLVLADTTNAGFVKSSAGQIYNVVAFNAHATDEYYLKLFNKASAPVVGTDVPVFIIGVGPNSPENVPFPTGLYFSVGIAYAVTKGVADSDTTALDAGAGVISFGSI